MKRVLSYTFSAIICIFIFASSGNSGFKPSIIDKIRPLKNDIPPGFIYGKVPRFYKKVFKSNPCMMNNRAIRKLAGRIYPGGDYSKISNIHVSILANKNTPFGDDIVCYVILYRDIFAAHNEIKKITDFTGFNSDRAIVLKRENIAVFLHVDDTGNYHHIRNMADNINNRLKGL